MSKTLRAATHLLLVLAFGTLAKAQEPTYRVVVALNATNPSEIRASQRLVALSLSEGLGQVSEFYSSIPAVGARVTLEGWKALSILPEVKGVSADESAQVESIKSVGSTPARALSIDRQGLSGQGVTVALIDTGVDAAHRDLAGVVIDEACFCLDANGVPCCPDGTKMQMGRGSARDDNGHGTHLAGIIAGHGKTQGLAQKAHIVAIKIASSEGSTSVWSMLSALDWIATSRPDVQVVNMSIGTSATYTGACDATSSITSALAAAGHTLRARGAVLVAAAGNSGLTNRMSAPACVSGFLSVGAVYSQTGEAGAGNGCPDVQTAAGQVACFSNSSDALSLLAPGTGIVSTSLDGGLAVGSGTSQAAAVVSGAAALLMERSHAGPEVDAALRDSGAFVTDQRNGRVTPRIDPTSAMASLEGR